ncbi:MAG: isochorismate synthase [Bacteroidetes bacterium]|nr:isochorismate synthase [Bacteroidota bacterium]
MALKDTSALYQKAHAESLAIAFFRLPGTKKTSHITGAAARGIKAEQKAFVFAPFDSRLKPYYILPEGKVDVIKTVASPKAKSTSKQAFSGYVKAIVKAIKAGHYQKVVAARILAADKPADFSPADFFDKLCAAYPQAFVSLTSIPGVGLWIGATPEVLASQNSSTLTTYALAGTKAIEDSSGWGEKEKEEQRIVTDFIRQKLEKITDDIQAKGPIIREAGLLKHLLTVFTLRSKEPSLWQKVVKALHPTPAVAGMPKAKSVKFIHEQESFDRRFYAGYLGPVNWSGKTAIFVNLRCMEVTDKQIIFYAGCGITADSDQQKEWLESERKIDVLRQLI